MSEQGDKLFLPPKRLPLSEPKETILPPHVKPLGFVESKQGEQLTPERITPQEALSKLVTKHDEYALQKMGSNEYGPAVGIIQVLQGDVDDILNATEYNENAIPKIHNWSMTDIGAGFLTLHEGETIYSHTLIPEGVQPFMVSHYIEPGELSKIDYNFGQQALTQQECRDLVGNSFNEEAKAMIAQVTDDYKVADLQKEILPGIKVHIKVIDDNNPYGKTPNQEPKYRVTGNFATVPLAGEAPLTGRTLLKNVFDKYKQGFRTRYERITSGAVNEGSFIGDTPAEEVIDRIAAISEEKTKTTLHQEDSLAILADPSIIVSELRMYLLAKMKYSLKKDGTAIPEMKGVSLGEQIDTAIPLYRALRQQQKDQMDQENLAVFRKITNREPVQPMTEEEREKIIQRNLEALEHDLVKQTPSWELDDEINKTIRGIVSGGRRSPEGEEDTLETSLSIYYETSSGKITGIPRERDNEFLPGDYSRLKTWVTNKGRVMEHKEGKYVITETGTNIIALTQSGDGPTLSEIDKAIRGDTSSAPEEENRRLLPERLDPREDYLTYMGERVQWGQSLYNEHAEGDLIFLRSIQLFNQRFGPSR